MPLLISNEWSEKNNLSVGDIIILEANVYFIKIPYEKNKWSELYTKENLLNSVPYEFEFNYQLIEYINYEKQYSNEIWWQESKKLHQKEKEKIFDTPFFIIETEHDFLAFEMIANKILAPCHEIKIYSRN